MQSYELDIFPAAIVDLQQNQEYVRNVIQVCEEQNGFTMQGEETTEETRKYVQDALESIALNVHCASSHVTQYLMLQNDLLDDLVIKVDMAKEKLKWIKARNSAHELPRKENVVAENLVVENTQAVITTRDITIPPHQHMPLAERLEFENARTSSHQGNLWNANAPAGTFIKTTSFGHDDPELYNTIQEETAVHQEIAKDTEKANIEKADTEKADTEKSDTEKPEAAKTNVSIPEDIARDDQATSDVVPPAVAETMPDTATKSSTSNPATFLKVEPPSTDADTSEGAKGDALKNMLANHLVFKKSKMHEHCTE